MSTPMTPEQLMEIRLREEAATPGPWEEHLPYGDGFYAYLNGPYLRGVGTLEFGDGEEAEADRAFTLNARQDVPALLAEVDRLRARVTELEAQAEKVSGFCAQRAEYVTALLNCHPDNGHDYDRWQGHAAARRQLSERLGLPVAWPAEAKPRVTAENVAPPVSSSYKSPPLPPGEALCTACGHNGAAHHHAGTACWADIPKRLGEAIRLCPCKAFTGGAS